MSLLNDLEPDRFQKLCQALLVAEEPGVTVMPVGQADGGRDALRRRSGEDSFVGYQVKTTRTPSEIRDTGSWVVEAIEKELAKIRRLVDLGMSSYVVMTNVRGTGTLARGTIDKVQAYLDENIPVSAACWWFDDLERKLEAHSHLKWQYPELLRGADVMARLFESDLTENRQRRERAFKLFIERQAHNDLRLKFKQTELQGSTTDLYVDARSVIRVRNDRDLSKAQLKLLEREDIAWIGGSKYPRLVRLRSFNDPNGRKPLDIPTATFLLCIVDPKTHALVLEGAPGQGKSTVGQYICQVHCWRLLDQSSRLSAIPNEHLLAPIRVPIRLDLRDVATWLQGGELLGVAADTQSGTRSIDTLIAATIKYYAGGIEFGAADLHALIEAWDLLLILDGLDEVADIEVRAQVVSEVEHAVRRLGGTARSLHVLVTSRPAAFVNSPGFPEDEYAYIALDDLDPALIRKYGRKWVAAKELDEIHAADVLTTLESKLKEPHIRDLARNPMQLAILLSLISTRGSALPDKRTSMYDAYMDVFFNREAEKDATVRAHRELLLELHGVVAWHLHSESELGQTRGNISQAELIELLQSYLIREGRDPALADELFRGAVERVVALVSRIEGTYEFEVQPLREYFCAKFLYDQAPLSRVGAERPGSKPDRFAAIARNPYWLNVARYFAGAYTKGELGGLADGLAELWQDPELSRTNHPRVLTTMLLSDYVFSQSTQAMRRATDLIMSELGIRHCLPSEDSPHGAVELPREGGRTQLRGACLDLLRSGTLSVDRRNRLLAVTLLNGSEEELVSGWLERVPAMSSDSFGYWFAVGAKLFIFRALPWATVQPMLAEDRRTRLAELISCGGNAHYETLDADKAESMDIVGALEAYRYDLTSSSGRCEVLLAMFNAIELIASRFHRSPTLGFSSQTSGLEMVFGGVDPPPWLVTPTDDLDEVCRVLLELLRKPARVWYTSGEPWASAVREVTRVVAPGSALSMALFLLASQSIDDEAVEGIKDCDEIGFLHRLFVARGRPAPAWRRAWEASDDRRLIAAAFLSFSPPSVFRDLASEVDEYLDGISSGEFRALSNVLQSVNTVGRTRRRDVEVGKLAVAQAPFSERFVWAMRGRIETEAIASLISKIPSSKRSQSLKRLAAELDLRARTTKAESWTTLLPLFRIPRTDGHVIEPFIHRSPEVTVSAAEEVVSKAELYPISIVEVAERRLRIASAQRAPKLGKVAVRDHWFDS